MKVDIDYEYEQIRMEFWQEVFLVSIEKSSSSISAALTADNALKEFDERFEK